MTTSFGMAWFDLICAIQKERSAMQLTGLQKNRISWPSCLWLKPLKHPSLGAWWIHCGQKRSRSTLHLCKFSTDPPLTCMALLTNHCRSWCQNVSELWACSEDQNQPFPAWASAATTNVSCVWNKSRLFTSSEWQLKEHHFCWLDCGGLFWMILQQPANHQQNVRWDRVLHCKHVRHFLCQFCHLLFHWKSSTRVEFLHSWKQMPACHDCMLLSWGCAQAGLSSFWPMSHQKTEACETPSDVKVSTVASSSDASRGSPSEMEEEEGRLSAMSMKSSWKSWKGILTTSEVVATSWLEDP